MNRERHAVRMHGLSVIAKTVEFGELFGNRASTGAGSGGSRLQTGRGLQPHAQRNYPWVPTQPLPLERGFILLVNIYGITTRNRRQCNQRPKSLATCHFAG